MAMPANDMPQSSWTLLRDFARLLLLAVVLPALLLAAVVLWRSAQGHRDDMRDRLNASAQASAHHIAGVVGDHLAVIRLLAEGRTSSGDAGDIAAWQADLARVRRNFPAFRSAYVTDAQGRLRASNPVAARPDAPSSIGSRPHFIAARASGRPQVSDVFQAQLFGTGARVSVVAPLFKGGRFDGAVFGSLNADAFASDQTGWLRARGMELLVLDQRGAVIHASEGLRLRSLDRPARRDQWTPAGALGERRVALLPGILRNGGGAYAHAEPLPFGWHVVVLMPEATLQSQLQRDATVMLGLLAVVIVGVLVIVWLRSRQQAASVHALLAQMQQFALEAGSERSASASRNLPIELAPLSSALASLSARVGEAHAETRRSLDEQRRLRAELQVAAHRLMTVQEQERHALSRELHDDIGQAITAMKLGAMALAGEDPATQRAIAAEIIATADQTIAKLRNLSLLLRPPQLDALGLEAALQGQVELLARNPRNRIELDYTALPMRPSPEVELACFRVAQEAVTNALRHADAGCVAISVRPQGDGLLLEVRDDGRGMVEGARAGMGLVTMRERTHQVGGRFEIESRPGDGSCVRAWMPLQAQAPVV